MTTPRRNPHLGADCPPWCVADHAREFAENCVGPGGSIGPIWVSPILSPRGPQAGVCGLGPGEDDRSLYLGLSPADAEQLAGLVVLLAGVTADQHRELAGFIRDAAAEAAGDGP